MTENHDPHAAHRETVREFSRSGGPLDKDGPNSTLKNPAWFIDGKVEQPTARRRALWRSLREQDGEPLFPLELAALVHEES